MEAALVGPSTLASAYRATTHFTPRDGVAEPRMATITASLIGYPIIEPRGFTKLTAGARAMAPFESLGSQCPFRPFSTAAPRLRSLTLGPGTAVALAVR
jgi:hypothetical protein